MGDDVFEFMAMAWECRDENEHYFVEIFGRMADGAAVCVTCATYQPYLYVQAGTADHIAGSAKKEGQYSGKCIRSGSTVIFEKLSFSSLRRRRGFARKAEDRGLKTWEAQLDPKYRILHDLGVTSTGWMRVRGFTQVDPDYEEQLKVSVPFLTPAHVQAVDRHDIAPIRLVSYDIETYSHDGRFPLPTVAENVITHVALTEEVYGDSGPRRKVCFCLCPDGVDWCPEEVSVRVYSSERDLLAALCKTVAEWDPDIFLAYNNYGFDNAYLEERMAKVDVPCSLGRDPRLDSRLREIMLSTKQKGKFVLQVLEMHGRINLDVMAVLKNEKQLNSYALNAACSDLLKGQADNQKHDVTPAEMFRAFREKDIPALTTVALYCMRDTELPLRLMGALKVVPNYVEMTRATLTHLSCILTRGQQIRVYSLLVKEANRLGYHVKDEPKEPKEAPVESREDDEEETRATGYQGATVLAPIEGAYYDPVVALDFASLYPSIMRAHNMCYSTLVEPHAVEYVRGQGVEVQEFSGVFFRQTPRGVLPQVLENLARYRKEAKRMMAQHEGTPLEAIYNGKQLAYKVVMNSAYGFTGVQAGFLPEMRIAKSVTYRGRKMLEETKATVEATFYGSSVIYGDTDSVMVRFAIDEDLDPEEKVQVAWKLGEEASALCKFPPPNELELEKVYMPYLLYGKKNYAALLWTPDATGRVVSKYVDIKGLSAVKRDTCSYVRSVSRRILDALLTLKMPSVWSTGNVIDMARSAADDLLEGRVGVEELVETRKLGGEDGFDTTYGPAYFVRIWGEMYVNGKGVVKSGHPRWWMPTIDKDGPHAWEDVVGGKLIILRAPGGEDFFDRSILHQTGSRGDAEWIMCEWDRGANAWSNERKRVKECMVLSQYIRSPGTPPHTMTVHETRQSVTVTDPLVPGGKKKEERLKAVFLSPHPPGQEPYVPKDQPAYYVRDAMWRRNPGSEPRPGDRVSFVYVKRPNTKACECAEDPAYAAEVGLEVDRHYYFRNRMKEPVEKLLKLHVGDDMQQVFAKQMSINLSDITDPSDLKHVGCREIKRHVAERTGKAPMSREATFATWMAVKDQSPRQGPPLKKGKTLQGQMSMKNFIPKRG